MSTKSPADRTLFSDQLEIVPVLGREKLADESTPSRTHRDGEKYRAQLHHNVVDALSAKSPADRALWNDQLEAVPVPSREQLAVESTLCRTQRNEAEHRVQLRHDLVDALSTKSPADRTLLNDRLEIVPVPSREQVSVESIRTRTQRDEEERRAQWRCFRAQDKRN